MKLEATERIAASTREQRALSAKRARSQDSFACPAFGSSAPGRMGQNNSAPPSSRQPVGAPLPLPSACEEREKKRVMDQRRGAQVIVEHLNNPPFSRGLNLIKFDKYEGLELLQVLNDVLAELSPEHKLELREEDPEETLQRILAALRVLKYRPEAEAKDFRNGLMAGQKEIIYHYAILRWTHHVYELQLINLAI